MLRKRAGRKYAGWGFFGLVLALGGWLVRSEIPPRGPEASSPAPAPNVATPPKRAVTGWPRRGATNPLVTVIQYSEFECPSCQRVARVLAELVQRHPSDLAVVWKDRPTAVLRPRSPIAAKFARGLYETQGNDAFWRVHDQMFQDLSKLRDADLARLGATLGFDTRRLLSAPAESVEKSIAASVEEARRLGIDVTPIVLINGRRSEVRTDFGDLVERELTEARRLEGQGLTRQEVRMKLEGAISPKSEET